ncbi:MAG: hypothetical protein K1X53_07990 [Candidatus Sumerlaeaceae bacterium]|nr:hypothetical protein [Candidatus Sumerlaeaceae bacterium]
MNSTPSEISQVQSAGSSDKAKPSDSATPRRFPGSSILSMPGRMMRGSSADKSAKNTSAEKTPTNLSHSSDDDPGPVDSTRTESSPTGTPRVKSAVRSPAMEDGMSRIVPGYDQPATTPREMQVDFNKCTGKLREALKDPKNNKAVEQELDDIRAKSSAMKGLLRDLPLEQRLKVNSISHYYDEGASLVEEGRSTGETEKVNLGLEKMDQAHQQLEKLNRSQKP